VLGRTLKLDGQAVPIVGVMPKEFAFPIATDIWLPLALTSEGWSNRAEESLAVVARLKPGILLKHAQTEMAAIAGRLQTAYPQTDKQLAVLVAPLPGFSQRQSHARVHADLDRRSRFAFAARRRGDAGVLRPCTSRAEDRSNWSR
jgi:hypothetical protein